MSAASTGESRGRRDVYADRHGLSSEVVHPNTAAEWLSAGHRQLSDFQAADPEGYERLRGEAMSLASRRRVGRVDPT